jgi:hypothetical protein
MYKKKPRTRKRKGLKMATVDMDSVGSFEVYPNGTYRATITGWEFGESSVKKTRQVKVKMSLEVGSDTKPYTEFIPITDSSAWKIGSLIANTGLKISGKFDTDASMFSKILDTLIDRTLYITLEINTQYNNNNSTGYNRDDQQPEDEFLTVDDAPEFAK